MNKKRIVCWDTKHGVVAGRILDELNKSVKVVELKRAPPPVFFQESKRITYLPKYKILTRGMSEKVYKFIEKIPESDCVAVDFSKKEKPLKCQIACDIKVNGSNKELIKALVENHLSYDKKLQEVHGVAKKAFKMESSMNSWVAFFKHIARKNHFSLRKSRVKPGERLTYTLVQA